MLSNGAGKAEICPSYVWMRGREVIRFCGMELAEAKKGELLADSLRVDSSLSPSDAKVWS